MQFYSIGLQNLFLSNLLFLCKFLRIGHSSNFGSGEYEFLETLHGKEMQIGSVNLPDQMKLN